MFRIVICDDRKENISFLNNSIRKAVEDIQGGRKTEFFSARPDALYNYVIKDDNTYIFILDTIYKAVSGIDIARRLRKQYKNIYIIFLTQHLELVNSAINYNIMPSGVFNKEADESEIKKALMNIYEYCLEDTRIAAATLTINTGSTVYKVKYDEIVYIESLNKKIHIYTNTQRISCYHSLQTLVEELGDGFIRCHKSYIINKKKIKNIHTKDMSVEMDNGSMIAISRTYKSGLKDVMKWGGYMNNNKMGYIFSKYEVAYISKLMGAIYLFNVNIRINEASDIIINRAKESLINKNYVFEDYNENFILSNELVEYFKPFVSPDKIIAVRKSFLETEENIVFYINDNGYTVAEEDPINRENVIFTYNEGLDTLFDNLMYYVAEDRIENTVDKKSRFIISTSEYKVLKDMVKNNDEEGINYFINNFKIEENLTGDIKKLFSEKKEFISFCFYPQFKTNTVNLKYLIYYFADNDCWKLNTSVESGDNMSFSSVDKRGISYDISKQLQSMTGLKYGENNNLFQ